MMDWTESEFNGYTPYIFNGTSHQEVNKTYVYWDNEPIQNNWFIYNNTTIRGLTAKYENGNPVYNAAYGYGQTDITIPADCTALDSSTFISLKNVDTDTETIVIPNNTLQTLYIPDNVTTLNPGAVAQCTALSTVRLSDELTVIPYHLFLCSQPYNMALQRLIIPHKVTTLEPYIFSGCKEIHKIYFIRDSSYTGQISIPFDIFDYEVADPNYDLKIYFTCSVSEAENMFNFGSSANMTRQIFESKSKYYDQIITND